MTVPNWAKWALKQALGTARGQMVIDLLSGPIGALIDTVALRGRGTIELDRITKQAQQAIDDIAGVVR